MTDDIYAWITALIFADIILFALVIAALLRALKAEALAEYAIAMAKRAERELATLTKKPLPSPPITKG